MPRNQGTSRKGKPKKDMRAAGFGKALQRCVFIHALIFLKRTSHHDLIQWTNLLHTTYTHNCTRYQWWKTHSTYMYMKNEWGNDLLNFSIQPEQNWMLIHISVVLTFFQYIYVSSNIMVTVCYTVLGVWRSICSYSCWIGHDEKI